MQVWQRGPFRIVVEQGDDDPPTPDEYEIALRVNPSNLAGIVGGRTVETYDQAIDALHKIEEQIGLHLGKLAPEIRDTIRNEAARQIPGLVKALGWDAKPKKT